MGRQQSGFTLIELVIVIVILGILAAFALPRFADLGTEARVATVEGAAGAVRSSASIVRSSWLAQGQPDTGEALDLEDFGDSIAISANGFPTNAQDGIGRAAQLSEDFVFEDDDIVLADRNSCGFSYDEEDGTVELFGDGLDDC